MGWAWLLTYCLRTCRACPRQMTSPIFSRCAGYLALWWTLVQQDLAVKYRGTLLGRSWPLLMPLLLLGIYGFVFGVVFRARWPGLAEGDHLGFALNLFLGLLVHGLFAESVGQAPSLFQRNSNFVRKIVFPLPVLVAVPLGSALFHMALGVLVVWIVNGVWGTGWHWQAMSLFVILPPYIVMLFGVSLAFSALGVYLRDLAQIVTVIVMLVLFTGTVFYPRAMVPSVFSGVVGANPISWPTDALRMALLEGQVPEWTSWAHYAVAASLVAVTGGLMFRALRPGFADVL